MSDTSRVQLAYVAESAFAVPKSGTALQVLRYQSENLRQTSSVIRSNEIRSDRMVGGVRRSRVEAAGSINGELSYGTWDDFLLAALQALAWAAPVSLAAKITIAAAATGNKYTDSANGMAVFAAGQWIYVSGFTTPANNGFKKIVSKSAGEIVVSGGTLADEVAGDSVTITQGGYIVNGTTLTTYNIEKTFADLTTELALLVGLAPSGLTLTIPQDGVVTIAFDFVGASESSITASNGNAYTAATTSQIFTARDLTSLLENSAAMGITAASIKLNNNLRTRLQAGSAGVIGIGSGTADVSGTIQAYYTTKAIYDKFLNDTASSVALALTDPAGNKYVFEVPAVKLTSGQRVAGGPNGDVMADMEFQGYLGATETAVIRVARFAAL
jgi:hypothetical protein